jgi:U4/U6.U5 tri-snRNP-associated protein 3
MSDNFKVIPIPSAPSASTSRPNLDPDAPDDLGEESEEMDAVNDDSSAMAAFMGLQGFGSTKGKPVEGNQEGAADVKKVRTWRQYMNRRGGFNRPLDKIK